MQSKLEKYSLPSTEAVAQIHRDGTQVVSFNYLHLPFMENPCHLGGRWRGPSAVTTTARRELAEIYSLSMFLFL